MSAPQPGVHCKSGKRAGIKRSGECAICSSKSRVPVQRQEVSTPNSCPHCCLQRTGRAENGRGDLPIVVFGGICQSGIRQAPHGRAVTIPAGHAPHADSVTHRPPGERGEQIASHCNREKRKPIKKQGEVSHMGFWNASRGSAAAAPFFFFMTMNTTATAMIATTATMTIHMTVPPPLLLEPPPVAPAFAGGCVGARVGAAWVGE
jgi:hypothetical protein